jgi:hypothetical protein
VLLGSGTTYAQKQDPAALSAQKEAPPGTEPFNRYFIGSSLFMVMNTVASPSPEFYQLNFGYWLTKKDVLSVEAITWAYHRPLGTPWGPDMSDPAQAYPGYVRAYGVGVAYQRYLWQGLYAAVHALPLLAAIQGARRQDSARRLSALHDAAARVPLQFLRRPRLHRAFDSRHALANQHERACGLRTAGQPLV